MDPVRLDVRLAREVLSYTVSNMTPYVIARVDIQTQFTSGGFEHLGCAVSAEISFPRSLHLPEVCRLPLDPETGKPIHYSSKIVHVEFDNGLTWKPDKQPVHW